MTSKIQHLIAADTERLIGNRYPDLIKGLDTEGLALTREFEQHNVILGDLPERTAQQLPGYHQLSPSDQATLATRTYQVLWAGLKPIHRALFAGRELDPFSLAGTLQRSLHSHADEPFTAIAQRLIETCTPVRMCEDAFDVESVAPEATAAFIAERIENGLDPTIAGSDQYRASTESFAIQVLTSSNSELVHAIKESIIIK